MFVPSSKIQQKTKGIIISFGCFKRGRRRCRAHLRRCHQRSHRSAIKLGKFYFKCSFSSETEVKKTGKVSSGCSINFFWIWCRQLPYFLGRRTQHKLRIVEYGGLRFYNSKIVQMQKTNGPGSKIKIKAQLRPSLWITALRWRLRIRRFGLKSTHNLIFMPLASILDYRCYAVLSMLIIWVSSSPLMAFPERPNRQSTSFRRSLRPASREWQFAPPKTQHIRWARSL